MNLVHSIRLYGGPHGWDGSISTRSRRAKSCDASRCKFWAICLSLHFPMSICLLCTASLFPMSAKSLNSLLHTFCHMSWHRCHASESSVGSPPSVRIASDVLCQLFARLVGLFAGLKQFLDASSHLYMRSCPSVGWSVGWSVGRSDGPLVLTRFF